MNKPSVVEELAPRDVARRLRTFPPPLLLDCRDAEELAIARIDGAAHIPMGDIPGRLPELDPQRETIVFCHHGKRSYKVALFLKEQGFERVCSMRGGIDAWSVEVDAAVPRY